MSTSLAPPVDDPSRSGAHVSSLRVLTSPPVDFVRRHRGSLLAAAVLLLYSSALAVAAWPGRMSADTLAQIDQVRRGEYSDWHAPLLLVLWRPFWLLGFGPGWVMWAAILTFSFGLYGILRLRFARRSAVVVTMVITSLPQVVGWTVYLGRDMWFTAFFLVAGAGLVGVARARGSTRVVPVAVTLAAVWLALAARQNALPACVILIVALVAIHRGRAASLSRRAAIARALGTLTVAGALALAIVGSQWLARRVFDVESTHIEQSIYIYDLAAISHEERKVLLDPEFFPAQDLQVLDARFDPSSFEPLVFGPGAVIPYPLDDEGAVEELRDDWVDAITSHPDSYIEERLRVWLEELAITEPSVWIVHPGVDPNPWGYVAANASLDDALQRYVRAFASNDQLAGGVIHRVWVYVLVLVGGLLFLRSSSAPRRCLGWISLSGIAYQGSLLVGLMATGYRLTIPCVVIAIVIVSVVTADIVARLRRRSAPTVLVAASDPAATPSSVV